MLQILKWHKTNFWMSAGENWIKLGDVERRSSTHCCCSSCFSSRPAPCSWRNDCDKDSTAWPFSLRTFCDTGFDPEQYNFHSPTVQPNYRCRAFLIAKEINPKIVSAILIFNIFELSLTVFLKIASKTSPLRSGFEIISASITSATHSKTIRHNVLTIVTWLRD